MNYRERYMYLSTKLNDVVYQKCCILEFSLSLSVRKLSNFAFIQNDFQILFYIRYFES